MTATVERDRVTAAFMTRAGGWFTVDGGLFRVLSIPEDSSERLVPVEDCSLPPMECAVRIDRADIQRGRVVRWPPGLE